MTDQGAGIRHVGGDQPDAVGVDVEFQKGIPVIEVDIAGLDRPARLAIDTGSLTVLRTSVGQEASTTPDASNRSRFVEDNLGNRIEVEPVLIDSVTVGGTEFDAVPGAVVSSDVFDRFCPPIDGLLGTSGFSERPDVFDRATWEIDRTNGRLRVDESWSPRGGFDIVLPVRTWVYTSGGDKLDTLALLVPIEIGGTLLWAAMDTGGAGLSEMTLETFRALGGELESPAVSEYVGSHAASIASLEPSSRSWIARFEDVRLGIATISSMQFRIVDPPTGSLYQVTLQEDLLEAFDIVVDQRRSEVRLAIREDREPLGAMRTQLNLAFDGNRITVAGMLKNGIASRAGIELGDELVEVGNESVSLHDSGAACTAALWPWGAEAETRMVLRRGDRLIEVKLKATEER